ncbi:ABC transporter substrate-binding protein [Streptomyces capparidis]
MKPPIRTAALAALALALAVSGCSGKASDDGDGGGGTGKGGVATGEGVTDTTITLGALTDATGVYASLGKTVTQSQRLWVKRTNEAGGICGRKIELVVRDHGYDAQKAVLAYTELEPKVLGFVQFIGSPLVGAVKDRVENQDHALIVPQAWSTSLMGEYVRVVGATYAIEMINAVDFLTTEKGVERGDKIGHIYFEGDYGEDALHGSTHAARELGLTVVEQRIKPTDTDMSAQVAMFKREGVKAVLISAGPRQAASLAGVAASRRLDVPMVGSNSAFASQLLGTDAGKPLTRDYHIAASTLPMGAPEPGPSGLAEDYLAEYPGEPLDNAVSSGWSAASLYGAVLKKACEDKDLTRQGVHRALKSFTSYDNSFGITHDFSDPKAPSTRQSLILKPDASVTKGGLRVVRPAHVSPLAKAYEPGE